MKNVPKVLHFHSHPITLAFAIADYKLQGKTLAKLIISVAPRPFSPHVDLKGFYVMVSRVRARGNLRLLHRPQKRQGGLNHLRRLHHTAALAAWHDGYNALGDWEPNRTRAVPKALPKRHRKRPRPEP